MERKTTTPYVPFDKVYSTTFKVALPKKSNLNPIKALAPITNLQEIQERKRDMLNNLTRMWAAKPEYGNPYRINILLTLIIIFFKKSKEKKKLED